MGNFNYKKIFFFLLIVFVSYLFIVTFGITFNYALWGWQVFLSPYIFFFSTGLALFLFYCYTESQRIDYEFLDIAYLIVLCIVMSLYWWLVVHFPIVRFIVSALILSFVVIIKGLPKLRGFLSKKTYLLYVLLLLLLVIRDPLVFGAMAYICLNILISSTSWYSTIMNQILLDTVVINGHWERDLDLRRVWLMVKVLYLILFLCTLKIFYSIYSLGAILELNSWVSEEFSDIKWWLKIWVIIFLGVNFIIFLGNIHIIWFRNMPVREKILATCVGCVKLGVVTVGSVVGVLVGMSYVPSLMEPTTIGNTYQIWFGRGFGFSTTSSSRSHHTNLFSQFYREYPFLINKEGLITDDTVENAWKYHKSKTAIINYQRREYFRNKYKFTSNELVFIKQGDGKLGSTITDGLCVRKIPQLEGDIKLIVEDVD